MRLITHNMLQCHVKNCNNNNFPLRFEDVQVELIEADFNPEFLANMLNKIDWDALRNTAIQVIYLYTGNSKMGFHTFNLL
jgi:multifunctional methyltransferase subunit TRM112